MDLKVNVKITLKDIRDFSFATAYNGILRKIFMGFSIIFVLLLVFLVAIDLFILDDKENIIYLSYLCFPLIFIICINILPMIMIYAIQKSNYKKSKLSGKLQCYELLENAINITSSNGNFSIDWGDVYKIQELKPCFKIFSSPVKFFIIPKRCFENEKDLKLFISIIISKVEKKKLKLKHYKLIKTSPDYGEIISDEGSHLLELDCLEPLLEVNFTLSKKELMRVNFRIYYSMPLGIIFTIIGVLLLFSYINDYILGNSLFPITLIFGLAFTIGMPIMIYYQTVKYLKYDAALKTAYNYKFYPTCYVVNHHSGTNCVKWNDLVKVRELKTTFLFFVTTQNAHVIPKRVFGNEAKSIEILRNIISSFSSKKDLSNV